MDSKAAASTPATDADVGKEENQPESAQSVKRAEMVRTTQSTESSIGGVSTRESSDEEVPATETSIAPAKRTPFTSLTQVDADMALARALQEQVFLCLSVKTLYSWLSMCFWRSSQYLWRCMSVYKTVTIIWVCVFVYVSLTPIVRG
jgi:hypothetical protein